MNVSKESALTKTPTIAAVLDDFLDAQRRRLSANTYASYADIIQLLKACLDGYGHLSLDDTDLALYNRLYDARGRDHREFCEIFGPGHILPNYGEFLGYFMVRKVSASNHTLRAAGTVTKKLARWLLENGHVAEEAGMDAAEEAAEAAKDLPQARTVADALDDAGEGGLLDNAIDADETVEGYFSIDRVEGDQIWLSETLGSRKFGPVSVPAGVSKLCKPGWTVSGILARTGRRWAVVEAWNVYP